MRIVIILITVLFINIAPAKATDYWGRNGHRATGQIAEKYLSKKAKKHIDEILNGESLAFVSTWGDEIKSDPSYRKYSAWHYVNFPFGGSYATSEKSNKGDLIVGINTCIAELKNKNTNAEDKAFYLKFLVHLMGDLHQPLHIGIAEDKGGNDFQVQWFGDGTNLHSVWDTKIIEDYEMSYRELAYNTKKLSKQQIEAIKSGDLIDWVNESRTLCEDVYENTEVGQKLGYEYMYKYIDVLRFQLQKGGIRLASVLNEIFG